MFKFLFKRRGAAAESMRVETENYKFLVTNKAEIMDVQYQGVTVIKKISFADPVPTGLKERFEDAFRDLEQKAFNHLTDTTYALSAERSWSKTIVFANAKLFINEMPVEIKIIITVKKDELIIEVMVQSKYKFFWGITVTILTPPEGKTRKAEKQDLRTYKRFEYAPSSCYVIEADKQNTLITSTYGSGQAISISELRLRPTVEGTDREVVNAWRLASDLSNYNTIVIKAVPKNSKQTGDVSYGRRLADSVQKSE